MTDTDDVPSSEKREVVELTKKQQLNNHIVLMRKVVAKAKVHIVNKLTKEIGKLRKRKGDDKAREKAGRKADRLLEEIKLIKHLKKDPISLYALQDKTKLEEVLNSPASTAETKALSRFSHHKLIQIDVQKYRSSNPHWALQIPVLLEKSKEKRRQIDKKLAEREAAKAKQLVTGRKINKKDALDQSKADTDSNDSESEVEEDKADESASPSDSEGKVADDSDSVKVKIRTNTRSANSQKLKQQKGKSTKKNSEKLPNTRPSTIEKNVGTVKIQFLKDLSELETTCDDPDSKVLSPPKEYRPKSSFFVGGIDEEEPDTRISKPEGSDRRQRPARNQSSESKPIFRKGKLINKPKPQGRFPAKRERGGSGGGRNSTRYFNKQDANDNSNLIPLGQTLSPAVHKGSGSKGSLLQKRGKEEGGSEEKLHPSWEAKKKQRNTLLEFQGKKVKFD